MTGLVQGGDTAPDEIILSLERMTAVESIDPVNRTMTVQAGVVPHNIHEAADSEGLQFTLDLGARGSCTIGGNVGTNRAYFNHFYDPTVKTGRQFVNYVENMQQGVTNATQRGALR